jgi:putative two-component system response regulator
MRATVAQARVLEAVETAQKDAQLQLYARDLRRIVAQERAKSEQLEAANRQLERYARDLHVAFVREQTRARELEKAHRDSLLQLLRAARFKDNETASHLRRIQHYCRAMAQQLGWAPEEVQRIAEASPMHDIGKIGVPDTILHKCGPLNTEEWRIVRRHPAYGALLLQGSTSPLLHTAREIALTHHERWDGTGYPRGLKGEAIPLAGRILAIADTYDALRCRRCYKPGYPHGRATEIILQGDGRTMPEHFDPQILDLFRELQGVFEEIHGRNYH